MIALAKFEEEDFRLANGREKMSIYRLVAVHLQCSLARGSHLPEINHFEHRSGVSFSHLNYSHHPSCALYLSQQSFSQK